MRFQLAFIALVMVGTLSQRADAALDVYLNFYFGDGVTVGTGDLAFKLRLEDSADAGSGLTSNQVRLTMLENNLVGSEQLKDKGFYLNLTTGKISGTTMSYTESVGSFTATLSKGADSFKADGDGLFDLLIGFDTSLPGSLGAGEMGSFLFTNASGLSVSDFNLLSAPDGPKATGVPKDGFLAATHLQATDRGTEGSVWIGDDNDTTNNTPIPGVPEPTSLAVWCLGMVAAGIGARRMRRGK